MYLIKHIGTLAQGASGIVKNYYNGSKLQAKVNQTIHFASENKKTIAKVAGVVGVIAGVTAVASGLYSSGAFALENCTTSKDWFFQTVTNCEPTRLGSVVNAIKNNSTVIGIATGLATLLGSAVYIARKEIISEFPEI